MVAAVLALAVGGCKKSEDAAAKPEEAAAAKAPEPAAPAAAPQDETPAPPEPPAQVEVPDFTASSWATR
jgi:hypothetical protein